MKTGERVREDRQGEIRGATVKEEKRNENREEGKGG